MRVAVDYGFVAGSPPARGGGDRALLRAVGVASGAVVAVARGWGHRVDYAGGPGWSDVACADLVWSDLAVPDLGCSTLDFVMVMLDFVMAMLHWRWSAGLMVGVAAAVRRRCMGPVGLGA